MRNIDVKTVHNKTIFLLKNVLPTRIFIYFHRTLSPPIFKLKLLYYYVGTTETAMEWTSAYYFHIIYRKSNENPVYGSCYSVIYSTPIMHVVYMMQFPIVLKYFSCMILNEKYFKMVIVKMFLYGFRS